MFTTQYIDTIHASSNKDVRQDIIYTHLYDLSFRQFAQNNNNVFVSYLSFKSYHITWNAWRALKTNKQTNKWDFQSQT